MRDALTSLPRIVMLTSLFLTVSAFGRADAKHPQPTVETEVRHELIMLPYYGVFDHLQYKVEGSKVTLYGYAHRPSLRSDAEAVVKGLERVESVDNQIQVLPVSPFDDRIRVAAYRALYGSQDFWKYAIQAVPPIHILVNNGRVTLEGVVGSELDKNLAFARVSGISGTFGVTNNLVVVKG